MPKSDMKFGLMIAVPDTAKAAWGARMIFPNDLLSDRQGFFADDTRHGDMLLEWLNCRCLPGEKSPLQQAQFNALRMSNCYELLPNGRAQVTLYEDPAGMIVANPRGSWGYLYVAAFLKDSWIAKLNLPDPPSSHDVDEDGNPKRNGVNP